MARHEADSPGKSVFNDRGASMSVSGMAMDLTKCDSNYNLTMTHNLLSPAPSERRSNFSTLRPSAAARKKIPHLSIQDVLGQGKPQYGMTYYKTPSNEMLLKRVYNGKAS